LDFPHPNDFSFRKTRVPDGNESQDPSVVPSAHTKTSSAPFSRKLAHVARTRNPSFKVLVITDNFMEGA
jgi:hypothetical protein